MFGILGWHHESKWIALRKQEPRGKSWHTFGLTNKALNLLNTRNISFALRAVPNLSLSRAMIWFSTLETRSLYAVSAAVQISEPSEVPSGPQG